MASRLPPIIKPFAWIFFAWAGFLRWLRVDSMWVNAVLPTLPTRGPVLWIANHASFWDGLVLHKLSRRLQPDMPFYAVTLAQTRRAIPWLRWAGTIPLDPAHPMSLRPLLTDDFAHVSMAYFPQGRIWPSTRRPLGFTRGIELLLRTHLRREGAVAILAALHHEPMNTSRFHIFIRTSDVITEQTGSPELEAKLTALLDCTLADRHELGEAIGSAWQRL